MTDILEELLRESVEDEDGMDREWDSAEMVDLTRNLAGVRAARGASLQAESAGQTMANLPEEQQNGVARLVARQEEKERRDRRESGQAAQEILNRMSRLRQAEQRKEGRSVLQSDMGGAGCGIQQPLAGGQDAATPPG